MAQSFYKVHFAHRLIKTFPLQIGYCFGMFTPTRARKTRIMPLALRRALLCGAFAIAGAAPALADATLPHMHPGFWETTMNMTMDGQSPDSAGPPRITYMCQNDATVAAAMKQMNGALPGCTFDMEGGDGNYTMTTNCVNPAGQPGTITGSGTMTLRGDSALHMTETSDAKMQSMDMKMAMTADSKWVGACPAGVMPGDFGTMTNGAFQKQGNALTPLKPMGQ
jgi:hypothetical protein